MKKISILFLMALFIVACEAPKEDKRDVSQTHIETVFYGDTMPSPVVELEKKVPKNLVVGFKELGLFFYDWPKGHTLNYAGYPLDDHSSSMSITFEISHEFSRVCKIIAKPWSHVASLAIGESPYTVGGIAAHRTVLPNGNLDYSFEINQDLGWIINVTELDPDYEDWLTTHFSSTINEQTDSLISLVSSPLPLQIPQTVQKIGVSFRTEAYHDDFFPRTKIEMRLTNFSNLMTNSIVIADVVGSVDNLTDGKQTFNEGEELKLKNFYAGLAKEWIFVHEGNELVLYEKTESEPSMEMENDMNVESKKILVLPIPEAFEFNFVGYFPMSE